MVLHLKDHIIPAVNKNSFWSKVAMNNKDYCGVIKCHQDASLAISRRCKHLVNMLVCYHMMIEGIMGFASSPHPSRGDTSSLWRGVQLLQRDTYNGAKL